MASAELRIINRRIKSVKSTKKITRAMELIASSRIVKAQQRMESSNSYVNVLNQIVADLVGKGGLDKDTDENKSNKAVIIVVTSLIVIISYWLRNIGNPSSKKNNIGGI